jgi:hypothetical protein
MKNTWLAEVGRGTQYNLLYSNGVIYTNIVFVVTLHSFKGKLYPFSKNKRN